MEAVNITNNGITEMAIAKANKDGGQYFVKKKIVINEKKLPITGNKDERATCWKAATTAVNTFSII